jgi:hypothetical protein
MGDVELYGGGIQYDWKEVVCIWAKVILQVGEEGSDGVCTRYRSKSHLISLLKVCLQGCMLVSFGVVWYILT